MPRKHGESNQQWMERLRRYRADGMMDRTRAAVCFVNSGGYGSEATKMNAFLALFHPDIEHGTPQHLALMQDARKRDQRK